MSKNGLFSTSHWVRLVEAHHALDVAAERLEVVADALDAELEAEATSIFGDSFYVTRYKYNNHGRLLEITITDGTVKAVVEFKGDGQWHAVANVKRES